MSQRIIANPGCAHPEGAQSTGRSHETRDCDMRARVVARVVPSLPLRWRAPQGRERARRVRTEERLGKLGRLPPHPAFGHLLPQRGGREKAGESKRQREGCLAPFMENERNLLPPPLHAMALALSAGAAFRLRQDDAPAIVEYTSAPMSSPSPTRWIPLPGRAGNEFTPPARNAGAPRRWRRCRWCRLPSRRRRARPDGCCPWPRRTRRAPAFPCHWLHRRRR